METNIKMCTACQKLKRKGEFHKNSAQPDGYNDWCIECMKEYRKQYLADAPLRRKAHAGIVQKCKGCDNVFPIESYYHDDGTSTGYRVFCPECYYKIKIKSKFIRFIKNNVPKEIILSK